MNDDEYYELAFTSLDDDQIDRLIEPNKESLLLRAELAEQKRDRFLKLAGVDIEKIPVDLRSKPISKIKAARLLGRKGNENRAVEWLNDCIEKGVIQYEKATRQSGFFNIDQFPKDKRPFLAP